MPSGCSYESLAGINWTFGIASLVLCVGGVIWIATVYFETMEKVESSISQRNLNSSTTRPTDSSMASAEAAVPPPTATANEEEINRKSSQILTQLNHVGAQATLASAFVW